MRRGLALSVFVLGMLGVASPAQAGILDQQQPVTSSRFGVGTCGSNEIAQTFTAGITGTLDQVDVFVYRDERNPSEPLRVGIHSTVNGAPSGEVLASASLPSEDFGTGPFSLSEAVVFASPAQVTAGTQYAIVLGQGGLGCVPGYWWAEEPGNLYPAGELWSKVGDRPWEPATLAREEDFAFRTYVVPLPPPAPTSKDECKDGGWRTFGIFSNQGDCVSSLSKNAPGGELKVVEVG